LEAVQKAVRERLFDGGYPENMVYDFANNRAMSPTDIITHMVAVVADGGP
jgi:hypothetical protein